MIYKWVLLFLHICMVQSVDRGKFKTCEQSGFCRRHRAINGGDNPYEIDGDSIQIKNSYISFNIVNLKEEKPLKAEIDVMSKGIYRLKINELNPLKPRYEAVDSLLQKLPNLDQKLSYNKDKDVFTINSGEISIILNFQPLIITFKQKDTTLFIINDRNLFKFEYLRTKPGNNQNSIDEKDEEDDPIPSNEVDANEDKDNSDSESNDSDKKDEVKDENGSWEETFDGHTDSKPNGPASLGVDISFPSFQHLYGIPEHADSFVLKSTEGEQPYRLYNFDVFEYEVGNKMALYGSIPFMLAHNSQRTLGIFWNNPSETWIDVSYDKGVAAGGTRHVPTAHTHWFSESGIVDLFLLLGPSAPAVFEQYGLVTGVTPLPPISALGYHQSRWNYNDQDDVVEVLNKFDEYDIPLDYIWLDIEYTDGKRYFTWDKTKFPNPLEMIGNLTAKGRKLVIIIDPHIKADPGYAIYDDAGKHDKFFVQSKEHKDFEGWCWPGNSKYPDFVRKEVRDWWATKFDLKQFPTTTQDVMVWNDMNEPSVFSGPEITMPKDATHLLDTLEHREIHNLYGLYVHAATFQGILERSGKTKRPFVLSRAFFSGSQRTTAVWTGDNTAEWSHLKISVPMVLSLSVTGMTFSGADIGGFFKNPDEELIRRWYQAGAFQPFFRSHAHIDTKRREPWKFTPATRDIITHAIYERYTYLPYWYTLFYEAEITAMPVMRPLWVEFPLDPVTFDIDNMHMIGPALMIHPVTDQGAQHVNIYFPGSNEFWYHAITYALTYVTQPTFMSVPVKDEDIPIYQRGGTIVPRRLRKRRSASINFQIDPYTLVVVLDQQRKAKGTLYVDDGDSYEYREGKFLYINYLFDNDKMTSKNIHFNVYKPSSFIERIIILGIERPSEIYITSQRHKNLKLHFEYRNGANTKVLTIKKPSENMHEEWTMHFKF